MPALWRRLPHQCDALAHPPWHCHRADVPWSAKRQVSVSRSSQALSSSPPVQLTCREKTVTPVGKKSMSNVPLSNGKSPASPSTHSISQPAGRGRFAATASRPALKSRPATLPAVPTIGGMSRVTVPVPQATSNILPPLPSSLRSTRSAAQGRNIEGANKRSYNSLGFSSKFYGSCSSILCNPPRRPNSIYFRTNF